MSLSKKKGSDSTNQMDCDDLRWSNIKRLEHKGGSAEYIWSSVNSQMIALLLVGHSLPEGFSLAPYSLVDSPMCPANKIISNQEISLI